jgi:hypothetical protein
MRPQIPLVLLLLLVIAANAGWERLGGHPQHWDSAIHFSESLNANRIGEDTLRSGLHQALNVSWYYPPFVSWASIIVYRILGESEAAGLHVMTLFFCILLFSVFGIGRELFGDREGILAALFTASFPLVIRYSHVFMLDLPLASMTALSLYLLLRTDAFERTLPSVALGLALGAGMLTKWTFPFFILAPFLYEAVSGLRFPEDRRRRIRNCALSILAAVLVASPWYLVHFIQIIGSRTGELGREGPPFPESIVYYIRIIPEEVSWFLLPLVIGGSIVCVVRFRARSFLPALSFLGGYVFLTLIGFKVPRFSIPLLAPLAVLGSAGCVSWIDHEEFAPVLKRSLAAALVLIPLAQFMVVSFVPHESLLGERLSRQFISGSIENVDGPVYEDWKQDSITAAIDNDRAARSLPRAVVRVIPDYVYFNNATVSLAARIGGYPILVMGTTGFPLFADYVLLKTGNTGEKSDERDRLRDVVLSQASPSPGPATDPAPGMYAIMHRWRLPDTTDAILVRVEPKALSGVSAGGIKSRLLLHAEGFIRRYMKPLEGFELTVESADSAGLLRGYVDRITVAARRAQFGDFTFNPVGITVENIRLSLTGVRFDPGKLVRDETLLLLSIGGLHVQNFLVTAAELRTYVDESSGGMVRLDSCSMRDGMLSARISSRSFGPKIAFDLVLHTFRQRNIWFSFQKLQVGYLPIPSRLVNILTSPFNPVLTGLEPLSEVKIAELHLGQDRLFLADSL